MLILLTQPALAKGKHPKANVVQDMEPEETSWLLTVEDNSYYTTDYLNATLEYSTISGWDVGITSQNIPMAGTGDAQNFNFDTYLQMSKSWEQGWGEVTLGSMDGYHVGYIHSFSYLDVLYRFDWCRVHAGTYYANAALSTTTSYVGTIFGFVIGDDDLYLQVDYFSGHSNVSGANASVYYSPYDEIKLYTGVLVPEKMSGNEFAGVVGVQFIYGRK